MFCVSCGTGLPDDAAFCVKCGSPVGAGAGAAHSARFGAATGRRLPRTAQPEALRKSEGVAVFLALFFGVLGLFGIGHLYAGYLNRAIIYLFTGFALSGISLVVIYGMGPVIVDGRPDAAVLGFEIAMAVLGCGVWAWQTVDARRCVRQYNAQLASAR